MHFIFFVLYLAVSASAGSLTGEHQVLPRTVVNQTMTLSIPQSPSPGRQIIDENFQSYSIEFSYMQDYAGNASHPNEFSYKMMQNLFDIRGGYPIIRAGGSTQSRAIYYPNQTQAVISTFDSPGADQPSSVTIGPAWMQSFQQFPKGTKYIYGLNFYDNSTGEMPVLFDDQTGLQQTVLEAKDAWDAIGDDIYAFEIGNEVDGWPGGSRRLANWTVQAYVDQWKFTAAQIGKFSIGAADSHVEPRFQGCAFEAPRRIIPGNTTIFNVESAIRDGIASSGVAKTVADHDYMGANCDTTTIPTIADNLLNHFHMTSLMWYHEYLGNFSVANGVPYVLGETNSISCQGTPGISDVFAASIWSVDYVLYVAQLNVSRLYFHNGTPYRYSAWQPIQVNDTAAHPKALYYGNLMTSTALAGGHKQVEILVNETSFTAYGIYNANAGNTTAELESVVVVNMAMWNATEDASLRPYTAVKLPSMNGEDWSMAKVQRLTAPGVDVADNITFAGQSVDNHGNITGTKKFETVNDGIVLVGAAEAVLVTL